MLKIASSLKTDIGCMNAGMFYFPVKFGSFSDKKDISSMRLMQRREVRVLFLGNKQPNQKFAVMKER